MITDMAKEIDASRLLVYRPAYFEDKYTNFTKETSMKKLFASEMAMCATRNAIQIFSGYGYTKDYLLKRYFRNVKLCEIGEGTSQVQKMVIAKQL